VILLDTCAAVWAGTNDVSLAPSAAKLIDDAARGDALALSAITAWEIGTLMRRGRLRLAVDVQVFLERIFTAPGVREFPVDRKIAECAAALDDGFHGDPADRIIVATAIVRCARLVTRDRRIMAYAKGNRRLLVLGC
jgi:PIN domain nuclease of toxin-antitoxin system